MSAVVVRNTPQQSRRGDPQRSQPSALRLPPLPTQRDGRSAAAGHAPSKLTKDGLFVARGVMVYSLGTVPIPNYLVDKVPLDGAPEKIRTVDQTPDGGVGFDGMRGGRRCHTEHFPTRIEWRGPPDAIGDFDGHNLLTVSERARGFIEIYEPGVHQFIPLDYVDQQGRVLERRFHFVVCNRLDTVDRDRTTFILLAGRLWRPIEDVVRSFPQFLPPGIDTSVESKLVFNRQKIGSAHIWFDKHIDVGGPLLTDEFYEALLKSGLTGVDANAHHMETV